MHWRSYIYGALVGLVIGIAFGYYLWGFLPTING